VLALTGTGQELPWIRQHCVVEASEDPIFCGMGRSAVAMPPPPPPATTPSLKDERVPTIVAIPPASVPPTAEMPATVWSATMIYEAELDLFQVPLFHAEWVTSTLPGPNLHRVPND